MSTRQRIDDFIIAQEDRRQTTGEPRRNLVNTWPAALMRLMADEIDDLRAEIVDLRAALDGGDE